MLLWSCQEHNDFYDAEYEKNHTETQYSYAFVEQFGEIAPTVTWGFEKDSTAYGVTLNPSTRGWSYPNANQYADSYILPEKVTDEEEAKVVEWFKTHQYPESISINFTDFFVQQVHKGQYGGNMNQLADGTDTHVNNFNNGDGSLQNVGNGVQMKIMMQKESSTEKFSYHNSADNTRYYLFVIAAIDGKYYVGFDYKCSTNNIVEPDGYYDDWIVQITEAQFKSAKRVMCEDLGAIGDFDFNDLVADFAYNDGKAYVKIQAAGGTLPICIGPVTEENEIHNLFGVDVSQTVNTTGEKAEKDPVSIVLSDKYYWNIDMIDITVIKNGIAYVLSAEQGKAPGKIACPIGTDWANEKQHIKTKYPKFVDYVAGNIDEWWN
jgi:hypothetical protein